MLNAGQCITAFFLLGSGLLALTMGVEEEGV